jgi:hypothetical protein
MRRTLLVASALVLVPAVALAGFRVSSFKKETKLGANYWNAAAALDSKLESCWMVDPESANVGEWFEIDLPKGTVDKLSLVIGWQRDESTFKDYPRIKTVKVEIFGSESDESAKVGEQLLTFEDKMDWQTMDLPDTPIGGEISGGRVRITVVDVYPGEDYPNLAVSEVLVRMKDQDVSKEAVRMVTPPAASATGHDAPLMLDGDAKTYWASGAAGEASFQIKAEGFGVSSIGIQPGPLTSARPKTIEIQTNDNTVTYTMADKPELQWFELPSLVGYTGSSWGPVTVTVKDTYPGKTDQNASITDVKLRYTNYEAI